MAGVGSRHHTARRLAATLWAVPAIGPFRDHGGRGQGVVEYGLILALTALVTVVALVFFGGALATALSLIGQAIDSSS